MNRLGSHSRNWKGGETRAEGYVLIYKPGHPRAIVNHTYVKCAVLVMEKKLGRDLEPGEVVHHINGIKDDDRPENLQVMTHSEHSKLHRKDSVSPSY